MKKILALVLALTICLGTFAACGKKTPASSAPSAAPSAAKSEATDKAVELRISWWGSEERHSKTLEVLDMYTAEHPNVTFVPEYSGYSGYQDKLIAQITAGNAPDIFSSVSEGIPQQMASDALYDLTGIVDVSDHNPMVVESCSYDGKLVSVPLGINAPTYTYNKRILDEIGVELPKENYTWDDFKEKCIEVYEKSNGKYYGTVDSSMAYEQFNFYGYTALQRPEPYPYDNEKMYVTEEDVGAYYQYWTDMRDKGGCAPPDISATAFDNNLVGRGIAVFTPVWSATFSQFQNETEDELGMILMPVGPNGEHAETSRPGVTMSIAKTSPNAEEAAKFIDWFVNSEEAALTLGTCRGVFSGDKQRKALMASDALSDIDQKVFTATNAYAANEMKLFYPGPDRISEIFGGNGDLVERTGQEIGFGKLSVQDGAKKFMAEANKILGVK
ncbi:MAG: ABC transporter substrate-binding protein [Ruthenibacterium sp.]